MVIGVVQLQTITSQEHLGADLIGYYLAGFQILSLTMRFDL